MRLTVVFITAASLCLCVGEDTDCRLGEQCTPTDKCPDYLVKRRKLDTYTKSGAQYHLLLGELKSQICNQAERKVCCSQPAVCGLSQLTTGFVRLHYTQLVGQQFDESSLDHWRQVGRKRRIPIHGPHWGGKSAQRGLSQSGLSLRIRDTVELRGQHHTPTLGPHCRSLVGQGTSVTIVTLFSTSKASLMINKIFVIVVI